jgi:hypothetical protein
VPVDLETIILKAVSKSPGERYESSGQMAADLQRFLDDEPILAKRPTLIQRTRKWSRRHPSVVITGMVLLIAGIAGLLVNSWMITQEQAKTKQRAKEAEERFQLAQDSVDDLIEIAQEELAGDPRLQNVRKRLLEAALAYYQKFIDQRRDDHGAQAQLAATRDRVKQIIDDLAVLQGARHFLLLEQETVLDDLRLSPEQRDRVSSLSKHLEEQRRELFRDFGRLTGEERSERFLQQARAEQAAIVEVLSDEKLTRFRQIAIQSQGVAAFREPDIAAELKLSAQQRERIRTIENEMFSPFRPSERSGDGPSRKTPEEIRRAVAEQLKAALAQIEALLTPEQAARWHTMIGEPLEGAIFLGPRGPRPPGSPDGPGRKSKRDDGKRQPQA